MFSFHDFVFETIKGMVGIEPEYKVRQYALNWQVNEVFTVADLEEIENLLQAQKINTETEVDNIVE